MRMSGGRLRFQRLSRWNSTVIGTVLVGGVCVIALLAPAISPRSPYEIDLAHRFARIGAGGHFLGTDNLGHDLLAQLIWGARPSLVIASVPVAAGMAVGSVLGGAAGYLRGRPEAVIMRSLDIFFALPPVLLAIALAAILGPGLWKIVIALSVVLIPPMARVVYQQVISIRSMLFVESARSIGATDARILCRHIFPNAMSTMLAYGASVAALSIVLGAGLSFIGLGIQPPQADWGRTINAGRQALTTAPQVATLPGVGIFVLSLGFNLIADGLRSPYGGRRGGVPSL
jgi:peptide/nickel transport system permease protein